MRAVDTAGASALDSRPRTHPLGRPLSREDVRGTTSPSLRHRHSMRSAEDDAEELFRMHTIEEIRETERHVREDIERKKEDVRQLVGARYRDLLDGADTLVEMAASSEKLVEMVRRMRQGCGSLQMRIKKPNSLTKAPREAALRRKVYALSSQVKLLVDTPEQIWACLDDNRFLDAAIQFLVAERLHTRLVGRIRLQEPECSTLKSALPLLPAQWATIRQFPEQIIRGSLQLLKQRGPTDRDFGGALAALSLLDHLTFLQAIDLFLESRKNCLRDFVASTPTELETTLVAIVSVVQMSLIHQCALFVGLPTVDADASDSSPLFLSLLDAVERNSLEKAFGRVVLGDEGAEEEEGGVVASFYPQHLRQEENSSVSGSTLFERSKKGLEEFGSVVQEAGASLLQSVRTCQELGVLERAVRSWIVSELVHACHWHEICALVVGEDVDLWQLLFQDMFLSKAQALVSASLAPLKARVALEEYLGDAVKQSSLGRYVWTVSGEEEQVDAVSKKVVGITGSVQRICDLFDAQLSEVGKDVQHLILCDGEDAGPSFFLPKLEELTSHLQDTVKRAILSWTESLRNLLEGLRRSLEERISQQQNVDDATLVDQALIIGRVCRILVVRSTSLRPVRETHPLSPKRRPDSDHPLPSCGPLSNTGYTELAQHLSEVASQSFSVWALSVANKLLHGVRTAFRRGDWREHPAWEEMTLRDDSDAEENIRVPSQPSRYVMSFLFSACCELHHAVAHTLDSDAILFVKELCTLLLQTLTTFLESSPFDEDTDGTVWGQTGTTPKDAALQMFFDFRLVFDVLSGRGDVGTGEGASKWQGRIRETLLLFRDVVNDPVDWALFEPRILKNVQRFYTRTNTLFGAIVTLNRIEGTENEKVLSLPEGRPNVLLLAPPVSRFAYLPAGTPLPQPRSAGAHIPSVPPHFATDGAVSLPSSTIPPGYFTPPKSPLASGAVSPLSSSPLAFMGQFSSRVSESLRSAVLKQPDQGLDEKKGSLGNMTSLISSLPLGLGSSGNKSSRDTSQ